MQKWGVFLEVLGQGWYNETYETHDYPYFYAGALAIFSMLSSAPSYEIKADYPQ